MGGRGKRGQVRGTEQVCGREGKERKNEKVKVVELVKGLRDRKWEVGNEMDLVKGLTQR